MEPRAPLRRPVHQGFAGALTLAGIVVGPKGKAQAALTATTTAIALPAPPATPKRTTSAFLQLQRRPMVGRARHLPLARPAPAGVVTAATAKVEAQAAPTATLTAIVQLAPPATPVHSSSAFL